MNGDLELAQDILDAWVRGDLEWFLEHAAPEVELRPLHWTAVPFRGREGATAFVREFLAAYQGRTIDVDSVRQAKDPVALNVHVRAHLRESRVDYDTRFTLLFWIRDEKLVRSECHVDEVALAAAMARPA